MTKNRSPRPLPWLNRWLGELATPRIPQQRSQAMPRKQTQQPPPLGSKCKILLLTNRNLSCRLPDDILLSIFSYLSTSVLQQTAQVCQNWYSPASMLLDRRRRHIRNLASCTLSQVILVDGLHSVEHLECLQYFEKMLSTRNDVFVSRPKIKWRFYCR
jgi:F-box-like